ncbi:hypothetical protein [Streptomyces sp. NPDC054887]
MVNDAVPQKDCRWVVLVEAETCPGYEDHRWQLVTTRAVPEGGRAAADGLACTIAMEYVPKGVSVGPGDTPARKVFRAADSSWLVEVQGNDHKRTLCRITVAELVRERKYVHAQETLVDRRRRLLG